MAKTSPGARPQPPQVRRVTLPTTAAQTKLWKRAKMPHAPPTTPLKTQLWTCPGNKQTPAATRADTMLGRAHKMTTATRKEQASRQAARAMQTATKQLRDRTTAERRTGLARAFKSMPYGYLSKCAARDATFNGTDTTRTMETNQNIKTICQNEVRKQVSRRTGAFIRVNERSKLFEPNKRTEPTL